MITRRQFIQSSATSALMPAIDNPMAGAQGTSVQAWPTRFVKLVVPFTPGGGIDGIGRIVGARLSEMWGQQVVVENKPGAGGNIASEFVARSAPDGYTVYITAGGLAVNRYLFGSINYDPVADFAPVTLICLFPNLLVVPNLFLLPLRRRSACGGQKKSGQGHLRLPGARQLSAYER